MAGETIITVIGNLTADPELRFTPSGSAVANFTIASTPRTFDRQSNEWKDGEALFLRASVWKEAAEIITDYTKDRTVGFNGNHSTGRLMETRNNGSSWTELHQFPDNYIWCRQLDNGEILACTKVDPNPRDMWLSTGYGTGAVTWEKVLSGSAPYVTFGAAWGFSSHENIVLIAEYGPKLPTWNGNAVTENARYVYMSVDYGKT